MRYTLAALALTAALPLLGGCGQIGPLYMPKEEAPQSKPVEQADTSQQKKTDESQ
jgi:predicted small lipoprotein YifL